MRFQSKGVLCTAALAAVLAFATSASAAPISKCDGAKKKCIGKYIAAVMGCHAKAESKNLPVDSTCLSKAVAKITGAGKGCFDKNEAKVPNDCSNTGGASAELAAADAFIVDIVTDVDPGYPALIGTPNKCGPARKKCVGKKAAGLTGCGAKESKDGIGDPTCVPKIQNKFDDPVALKGCDRTALAKNVDCLGGPPTSASLEAKVDAWNVGVDSRIEAAGGGNCGNGSIDLGEDCDPAGGGATSCQTVSNTSAAVTCSPTCTCACPSTVVFSGDATDPASILDTGWTGISHRAPIISNGDVTIGLSGCTGSSRPCGTCNVNGPVANPSAGAGQLDSRRCSNDTSVSCTSAAQCGSHCIGGTNMNALCANDSACPGSYCAAAGTCEFYFGSLLPLAAGGVTTCVANEFSSAVTGTANVETGEAVTQAELRARVYTGIAIDNPCPRCVGDGSFNDNVNGGTCDAGARAGKPCDKNGAVPGRPDFGSTSLDCPLAPGGIIATLPIDLSNETNPVVKTLTTASPNCTGSTGEKCLCGTCNNANQEPCFTNADCPPNGGPGVCNGLRCIGGTNNGAPCTSVTACPGGGLCNRPGEPTKPSACLDNTATPNALDCLDGGDGEGSCTEGPVDNNCSVASGHAQRGCTTIADCGGGAGSCVSVNRKCFLTGGGSFQPITPNLKVGTDTLIAVGMEDTPMNDVSHPTLGAVFCVGPTGSSSVNNVAGLPGPSRITIRGTAVGTP